MNIYTKEEAIKNRKKLLEQIENGAVFIYPTDTIYGIGCDAENSKAVKRIRELKERDTKPFSVIAPGFEWINKNCEVSDIAKKWMIKLPGAYTLVLNMKKIVVCAAANGGLKSLGVRIPEHWISEFVEKYGKPIVTTSVNKSGKKPCVNLEQLKLFDVDFIIYEGEKKGSASTVVDLRNGEVVKKR